MSTTLLPFGALTPDTLPQDEALRSLLIYAQLSQEREAHVERGGGEVEWVFRLSDFIVAWTLAEAPHLTAAEIAEQIALELEGKDPLSRIAELESLVVVTQLRSWTPEQHILPQERAA